MTKRIICPKCSSDNHFGNLKCKECEIELIWITFNVTNVVQDTDPECWQIVSNAGGSFVIPVIEITSVRHELLSSMWFFHKTSGNIWKNRWGLSRRILLRCSFTVFQVWLGVELHRNQKEKMTVDKICRGCIRCKKLFNYGNMDISLRGQMTRRYCNECIVLQHRDESRLYQRRKRLNMRIIWYIHGI